MRRACTVASRLSKWPNIATNLSSSAQVISSFCIKLCFSTQCCDEEHEDQRILHQFKQCPGVQSLNATKCLHALTIILGQKSSQTIYLYNNIMSKYLSLGDTVTAHNVFGFMRQRNVVSYNALISAYSKHGDSVEAWKLFCGLRTCFEPTPHTFSGLLSCPSLDLFQGFYLQCLMIKSGVLCGDAFAGTALLGFFGRYDCLENAVRAFEEMPVKNVVTWNSMIMLFGHHGLSVESVSMFRELIRTNEAMTESSFVCVLSGFQCEYEIEAGEQIHGLVIKKGMYRVVSVTNSLINMYCKCSGVSAGEKLFAEVPFRDIVSWNTIMRVLSNSERPDKAIDFLLKMHFNEVMPNETTYASAINCCSSMKIRSFGEYIHAKVIRNLLQSNVFVGSSLVDFYAKCGTFKEAYRCFEETNEKNLVSWNSIMLAYSRREGFSSVFLLQEMIVLDYSPNEVSFSTAIKSSAIVELWQLHSLVIKMGYLCNDFVLTSLIVAYAKNGQLSDALIFSSDFRIPSATVPSNVVAGIFNKMSQYDKTQELYSLVEEPDIMSWNILIAACSRNGDFKEAFELFEHMQRRKISADNYTWVSLLSICTRQCTLALGSSLHGLIIKTDSKQCDTFVLNVIIDMYGKCGNLESSVKIFNQVIDKNVITWTAVISALGLHGYANEALKKFREMVFMGFKPDGVSIISVLSACRHVGLVDEGIELFDQMQSKFGVEPEMDHYLLVVDMLTRYGYVKKAEQLIASMPFPPNAFIWRSFLDGCKKRSTLQYLA